MPRSSGIACIYRVTSQHNTLIRPGADGMQGRLLDTDWVAAVNPGTYLLLAVDGRLVTGRADYPRFHAKSMGTPIDWRLTPRDLGYLALGETIEAPMDLARFLPEPEKTHEDEVIPGRFPRTRQRKMGDGDHPDSHTVDDEDTPHGPGTGL
jgi:hypothetical protein